MPVFRDTCGSAIGLIGLRIRKYKTGNMITKEAQLTTYLTIQYDPNSEEVKNTLKSYRAVISEVGDIEDILKSITYAVSRWGEDHFIEGVGYVKTNGKLPSLEANAEEYYSGFNLIGEPSYEGEIS